MLPPRRSMRGMGGSALSVRQTATTLWRWSRRAIGRGVGRLLVAELAALVVLYGLASRLFDPLLRRLLVEIDLRAASFLLLSAFYLSVSARLQALLMPASLSSLLRQPIGTAGLVFVVFPWATLVAWPLLLLTAFGQPATPALFTTSIVASVAVIGLCAARGRVRRLLWATGIGVSLIAIDRYHALAHVLALLAMTIGIRALAPDLREAFGRGSVHVGGKRWTRLVRWLWRPDRSSLAALFRRDLLALGRRPGWISRMCLPLLCALFLLLTGQEGNGNCDAACLDRGVLFLAASCAVVSVAALSSVRHVQGLHWLTPDRTVPTTRRVLSLGLIAAAPTLPFLLLGAGLSGEPSLLPFSIAVVLIALHRQLADPNRDVELGRMLWSVTALLFISPLPTAERLLMATGVMIALLYLVDRRARQRRRERDTGVGYIRAAGS